MSETTSNKTIAKNTIFLYFRSFLMMAISLFSSRVILQALGVEDYGLYGAIGSIVAMFTIINGVLAAGTSRFLTFELGKGDKERLRKTFSASFTMHCALAIILFVLLETIGVWFLNNKMNIPAGREFAANVVLQLSILSCMLSLTQVPYSASIIAHEKMNVYAYVGIVEAIFKLALIFVLLYIPFTDNLIAYAIILTAWSIGLQIWYRFYCRKRFTECNLMIVRDKGIYKGMLSYSLWDLIGQFIATGNSNGINILINMFFGATMNAARSVAYQVESALLQFSNNFMTAVQPQIVKSYAQQDFKRFFQLIYESGRYSFYLLFLVTLPLFLEAEYVLSLWLVEVPELTLLFLRCIMLISLFRAFSSPLIKGVHATGDVKFLNLTSGIYGLCMYLPIVYLLYKLGFPVWVCFCIQGLNCLVCSYLEALSLKRNIDFSLWDYFTDVYLKSFMTIALAAIVPVIIVCYMQPSFIRFMLTGSVSVISTVICIYTMGISADVRRKINSALKDKLFKSRE